MLPGDDPAAGAGSGAGAGPLALFHAAACGLLRTDAAGVIQLVNSRFTDWVGFSASELVGHMKLQDLLTMGGKIFHQTHWTPLLQMQGSVSEVKLEVRHKDGGTLPMVMNAIRRSDESGHIVHDIAAFVARDRHKYEQELLNTGKRLELLVVESKRLHEEANSRAAFAEQMMGIVSHDLRNPLSTIKMSTVILARGETSANQRRVIDRISRAVEQSNRLIADLLDFTAAQLGGGIAIATEPFELNAAMGECVGDLALAFPERRIVFAPGGEGAGLCVADPLRLSQLVGNLVANAVTYGAPGTTVVVATAISARSFSVSVQNQGQPIPPEQHANLFRPMSRGTTAGAVRSVGLGLFIVGEIVKAHRGTVSVACDAAAGTVFTATFPRESAD